MPSTSLLKRARPWAALTAKSEKQEWIKLTEVVIEEGKCEQTRNVLNEDTRLVPGYNGQRNTPKFFGNIKASVCQIIHDFEAIAWMSNWTQEVCSANEPDAGKCPLVLAPNSNFSLLTFTGEPKWAANKIRLDGRLDWSNQQNNLDWLAGIHPMRNPQRA